MSVPSYSFHSLTLRLSNKGIGFSFPLLKLPNKGRKEYSKIILFIHFPPLKRVLSDIKAPSCTILVKFIVLGILILTIVL